MHTHTHYFTHKLFNNDVILQPKQYTHLNRHKQDSKIGSVLTTGDMST